MKRLTTMICSCLALLATTLLTGCGTTQHTSRTCISTVALADLGPVAADGSAQSREFSLGAGDALGAAIFTNYITIVRASSPTIDAAYANAE